VTPLGGHIERTYQEWQNSIFASSDTTCAFNGTCHMASSTTKIPIAKGGPSRIFHAHTFPAVDIAFDPNFPPPSAQIGAVEDALKNVLQGALCVNAQGAVRVILDNAGTAHFWPTGSAQDRRAWVEVVAYKNGVPFYSSGSVAPGQAVGSDPNDHDLWLLRDQMFDTNGQPVSMFWQAACAGGNELQVGVSTSASNTSNYTHRTRLYPNDINGVLPQMPDKVIAKVHLQPIGLDVLADLVDSGDLDRSVKAQMPTLTVTLPTGDPADGGAGDDGGDGGEPDTTGALVWTPETATSMVPDFTQNQLVPMSCVRTEAFLLVPTQIAGDPPKSCPAMASAPADGGH
jgi:hypothetical protein